MTTALNTYSHYYPNPGKDVCFDVIKFVLQKDKVINV